MILLPLLLLQAPSDYAILKEEYARPDSIPVLLSGLKSQDPRSQRLSLRAIGRLERPALRDEVVPFLHVLHPGVRKEAVGALAQMNAPVDFASLLATEKNASVRGVIYESIGRAKPLAPGSEAVLIAGLKDAEVEAKTGAARGLETLIRTTIKTTRPSASTIDALREAIRENTTSPLRQFALLALNAAGDQDAGTFDVAALDQDPQVRRLAVIGSKRWSDDPSPIVRLEALRVAGTCDRAVGAVNDVSGHVSLAAVDLLGAKACDAAVIQPLVDGGKTWRVRAHALVSLAKVAPASATPLIAKLAKDPMWQVRVYTADAAKVAKDTVTLQTLATDPDPNVAAAAMTTSSEAIRALSKDHSGLLMAAAARLKGSPELKGAAPTVLATVLRLTHSGRATVRDARVKLIELLNESADGAAIEELRPLLADRDPAIASLVAKVLTEKTGTAVEARTKRYDPEPFPLETVLKSLEGASAEITMKGLGSFKLNLLPDEAPATVASFAALADKGAYNGLTFHRVVPNFVLQGGSPGADEYDALTPQFMRDEVGFASNTRGTFGISTRGRDTGDGQIFVNLVDNWRLDHLYTVFANVTSGLDIVDSVLEGDVVEKVVIRRKR